MSNPRLATLRGIRTASRIHRNLDLSPNQLELKNQRINIFKIIVDKGIPLVFRPLRNLLGAFIHEGSPGILLTTNRPMSVQRITGAHEFGHFCLNHNPSLDDESMLTRTPTSYQGRVDLQEFEADAFALEFLVPNWLLAWHFQQQNWTRKDMRNPQIVYQLSLRVGTSYEATCRALIRHKIINSKTVEDLLRIQPKQIKSDLLSTYKPQDWRRDVWLLTERDEGSVIEGSNSDLFILKLKEHSGSGYLWNFLEINQSKFAIVKDEREGPYQDNIGGHVTRTITAESVERHLGGIALAEERPWLHGEEPLNNFRLQYDLLGPEMEGLSKVERLHVLGAA